MNQTKNYDESVIQTTYANDGYYNFYLASGSWLVFPDAESAVERNLLFADLPRVYIPETGDPFSDNSNLQSIDVLDPTGTIEVTVVDHPLFERRIGGVGPEVNALEWDVKMYFALSAAMHDAACAAWAVKRYYSSPRPITMIPYMGSNGQFSDPAGPSYDPQGLPLVAGVVEVITAATTAAGERHETIWDVAVFSWPGEHPDNPPAPSIATHQSTNRWMLAKDWLPFQRKSFNNPAIKIVTAPTHANTFL